MNDHFTDEDIKQLVPEARHQIDEKWLIGKLEIAPSATVFNLLLTTRKELNEARNDLADGSAKFMEKILECKNLTARISELEGALKQTRCTHGFIHNSRCVECGKEVRE